MTVYCTDAGEDGGLSDGDNALGHHRDEVTVREFVAEVPTDAQDD